MKRREKQYIAYSEWPAADKRLWEAAFARGKDVFADASPGSPLADRTLAQLEYTYGKFLFFLAAECPELLDAAPADRVIANAERDRPRAERMARQ